ncbi:MAG TPA: OmpH family outer membrane protein [bacterium]|nr:OmpH family outer membrane protein [bacterium]HMW36071.1 OmpH family outer membrane protein [bacterium]HMY35728.1 OmpH family outer membrane protein [bacterium]HMZ05410.1 OmpH family outer membrane protein [bacterium]HNB08750.1 OmpH family outer membrane protein [bacterium]
MKKTMIAILMLTLGINTAVKSQGKIGYADSQKILQSLKETETVQTKLQAEQERIYKQFQYMQDSLQTMQEDYVKNYRDNPLIKDNIKQTFQKGMEELAYLIQNSQQKYQEEMYKKQQELMAPILDKVKKAIETVRKAKGYDMILDSSPGMILAYDPQLDMTQKTIDELIRMATAAPTTGTGGK